MATFQFLPENSYGPLIKADIGVDAFTVQELYSDWMDWLQADPANHAHLPIFADGTGNIAPEGNKSLGAAGLSPQFYFVLNGWCFEPQDANGVTTITGNLFPDPNNPRPIICYPVGYDATVEIRYSNQAQQDYATMLAEIILAKQAAQGALATNFV